MLQIQTHMELKGRHTVNAIPSTLWTMLMDTDILSKIIPGVSKLEKTGENSYKSTLELQLGPFSASFAGDVQMEDITDQKRFTLKMQQSGKVGNATSTMKIELIPANGTETEVVFDGEVNITGLIGSMGNGVLSTAANVLTKQFFVKLDHELAKQQAGQ